MPKSFVAQRDATVFFKTKFFKTKAENYIIVIDISLKFLFLYVFSEGGGHLLLFLLSVIIL